MSRLVVITFLMLFCFSCKNEYTPKQRGYFRIELPKKEYVNYVSPTCPYKFDIPVYAKVLPYNRSNNQPCWVDIIFPSFDAKIYISYVPVLNNLNKCFEDSRVLAMKHIPKAEAIEENVYSNPENKVYGVLYTIEGNAASSVQFYLTDSTNNFIRGALYFNSIPNADSLEPVIKFVKEDILHLIETLQWK